MIYKELLSISDLYFKTTQDYPKYIYLIANKTDKNTYFQNLIFININDIESLFENYNKNENN